MSREMNIKRLTMRFSDGGTQPPPEPTPAPVAPGTTPPAAAQTQSTAVNVDIEQLITQAATKAAELAEKKNESVFKSMLKQSGLDDAAIQSMLAEYKAKQVTPEQTIQKLTGDIAARDAKLAAYEKAAVLRGHGLTDAEDIEVMTIRIDRLVTDGKDFATAAQEYFTANPRPAKAPASVVPGVTGNTPLTPDKPTKEMTYEERYKLKHSTT